MHLLSCTFLYVMYQTIIQTDIGVARIFCWGCTVYRGPKLMKWYMCIMPRSSLPTPATNGQHSTGMQEQLQLFFSMQHSSRQSYATCHVLVQYRLANSGFGHSGTPSPPFQSLPLPPYPPSFSPPSFPFPVGPTLKPGRGSGERCKLRLSSPSGSRPTGGA